MDCYRKLAQPRAVLHLAHTVKGHMSYWESSMRGGEYENKSWCKLLGGYKFNSVGKIK